MARTVRNAKIDTRSARAKLAIRREPYWTVLARGCALGYRKGVKSGSWIVRFRDDDGRQHYQALGAAADNDEADDITFLSFAKAQAKAREWISLKARELDGEVPSGKSYTVRDAMMDYLAWYAKNRKSLGRVRLSMNAHILPTLGNIPVSKLTRRKIERWHASIAEMPARLRTRRGATKQNYRIDNSPEGQRRRRCSANKQLTILKAALNRALDERRVSDGTAWQSVKPFREVDTAKVEYLSDGEAKRLVNACAEPFRGLVTGALLTGCRYGELVALQAKDFDQRAGTLFIRVSKSGKPRHVRLTDEGRAFFARRCAEKALEDLMFVRVDGKPWKASQQRRPLQQACKAARLKRVVSFHVLRHSFATRLVTNGVPLVVVAAQLGHRDTRITERHYSHLSPSYVAEVVRRLDAPLGIVPTDNVIAVRERKGAA